MAFTIEERQTLGIHGLLPAAVKTQEEQLELCRLNLDRYTDDLSKYIYLIGLLVHETRRCYRLSLSLSLSREKARKTPSLIRPRPPSHVDSDAQSCSIGQKRETLLSFIVRGCSQDDAAGVHAERRSGLSEVRPGLP